MNIESEKRREEKILLLFFFFFVCDSLFFSMYVARISNAHCFLSREGRECRAGLAHVLVTLILEVTGLVSSLSLSFSFSLFLSLALWP